MSVRDAVDMIRATPQSRRRDFAAKMRRRNPAEKKRPNPWPFSRPDARRTTPARGGIAYHTSKSRASESGGARAKSKKAAGSGAFSLPDERTIQEGFKRGLSLREILAANPALKALRTLNPAKFDRCVKEVKARGGAVSPYAVCTAAGKRNPSRYIIEDSYGISYGILESRGKAKAEIKRRKLKMGSHGVKVRKVRGFTDAEGYWAPYAERPKRNPAGAAAEAFEKFHGFEPSEVITVTKKIFHHEHLAAAGELPFLKVWGIDGRGHTIDHFKGTILAFNETMNQLFAEAGDQRINLKDFGITKPHELETLGRIVDIGYHTKKTHLGSEGGEAVYVHKFRTTNDNGKHVVVKIARYPDLIYDVRNEQLLFSGGSYEILREGIDK